MLNYLLYLIYHIKNILLKHGERLNCEICQLVIHYVCVNRMDSLESLLGKDEKLKE